MLRSRLEFSHQFEQQKKAAKLSAFLIMIMPKVINVHVKSESFYS
jgi:hypothetical protein